MGMMEFRAAHVELGQAHWLYHMVNTKRPLLGKTTLFWHQVFATGAAKVDITYQMIEQTQSPISFCDCCP